MCLPAKQDEQSSWLLAPTCGRRDESWGDDAIQIDGFGSAYGSSGWTVAAGDNVTIKVTANGQTASWSGTIPAASTAITAVHLSGSGANLALVIDGTGFGSAPEAMPYVGNLADFALNDTTGANWSAGATGDGYTLDYESWTDTQIVVDGISGTFPTNPSESPLHSGDQLWMDVTGTATGQQATMGALAPSETTYTYDADGNETSVTNPDGETTTYTYNALNEKVSETPPTGAETTYSYDPRGLLIRETVDPTGSDPQTTSYTYNTLGEKVSMTEPGGQVTTYAYRGRSLGYGAGERMASRWSCSVGRTGRTR